MAQDSSTDSAPAASSSPTETPASPASSAASSSPATEPRHEAPEEPGPKGADSAGVQDRVVMASRRADGSPAQSGDFEFIGPKSGVLEAAKHQHVSAAYAGLETASDPDFAPTPDDYDSVVGPAEQRAQAEVDERHRGAFDDDAR